MAITTIEGFEIQLDHETMWTEAGKWLRSQNLEGLVGLDIGCHLGYFSLQAIKQGAKKMYAYEASKRNWGLARYNASHNNLQDKIIVTHRAVADTDGQVIEVKMASANDGQRGIIYKDSFVVECEVQTITLASILEELHCIDFIKCDTEGAEWQIFHESQYERLRPLLSKVKIIEVELHDLDNQDFYNAFWMGNERDELKKFLESCGFEIEYYKNPAEYFVGHNRGTKC